MHNHTGNNSYLYSVNTIAGTPVLQPHQNSMSWKIPVINQDSSASSTSASFTTPQSPQNNFSAVVSEEKKTQKCYSTSKSDPIPRLHNQDRVDGHESHKSQINSSNISTLRIGDSIVKHTDKSNRWRISHWIKSGLT